ncbi:hypothetical protein SeLEV6574_g01805 [Synchytrium endobioticum]|nr:hypothetical protein SeLEV6574_g01805 [Synchytrium endobioticum]
MAERLKRASHHGADALADPYAVSRNVQIQLSKKASELYKQQRCQPLQTFFLPWLQIPVFITVSLTLRSMCAYPLPFFTTRDTPVDGFQDGGTLWFLDLTAPDPTWILPVCLGILHNTNLKHQAARWPHAVTYQRFNTGLRFLMLVLVPIMAQVPAGVTLYWVASASFSLVQNTLLIKWIKA